MRPVQKVWLGTMVAAVIAVAVVGNGRADELHSLQGTWVLDSAFEVHADGHRSTIYGQHPAGLLLVDASGRYDLQIFRDHRPNFASGDKTQGTADEYKQAVLGSSTHFGKVSIDTAQNKLIFDVEAASFPNWEGKRQVRDFTYQNGLLSYAVPPSADGTTAYSVWRRADGK